MAVLARDAELYSGKVASGHVHLRPDLWRPTFAERRAYAHSTPDLAYFQTDLPPSDLIPSLLDGYFGNVNIILPILHRPLFESQLRDGLHMRDGEFLRLLLVVCAVGARWCDDPRVLEERWPVRLSAGYRWFRSAYQDYAGVVYRSSLWNVQFLTVCTIARSTVVFLMVCVTGGCDIPP